MKQQCITKHTKFSLAGAFLYKHVAGFWPRAMKAVFSVSYVFQYPLLIFFQEIIASSYSGSFSCCSVPLGCSVLLSGKSGTLHLLLNVATVCIVCRVMHSAATWDVFAPPARVVFVNEWNRAQQVPSDDQVVRNYSCLPLLLLMQQRRCGSGSIRVHK